jgi:hypothetical protein
LRPLGRLEKSTPITRRAIGRARYTNVQRGAQCVIGLVSDITCTMLL